MSDPAALRNRLMVAVAMWKETTGDPLPKMPPGDPEAQVQGFELRLVDALGASATPRTAPEVADRTWDLVHDRPDSDPVKRRVVKLHGELARLRREG